MEKNKILGRQPVFGDEEQIKFLKETEEYQHKVLDGEIDIFESCNARASISFSFKCAICMSPVDLDVDFQIHSADYDFTDELDRETCRCRQCKTQYEIDVQGCAVLLTIIENPRYPERITKFKTNEESSQDS